MLFQTSWFFLRGFIPPRFLQSGPWAVGGPGPTSDTQTPLEKVQIRHLSSALQLDAADAVPAPALVRRSALVVPPPLYEGLIM
ncbi:unnamed protein product [Boreogadus saida]